MRNRYIHTQTNHSLKPVMQSMAGLKISYSHPYSPFIAYPSEGVHPSPWHILSPPPCHTSRLFAGNSSCPKPCWLFGPRSTITMLCWPRDWRISPKTTLFFFPQCCLWTEHQLPLPQCSSSFMSGTTIPPTLSPITMSWKNTAKFMIWPFWWISLTYFA